MATPEAEPPTAKVPERLTLQLGTPLLARVLKEALAIWAVTRAAELLCRAAPPTEKEEPLEAGTKEAFQLELAAEAPMQEL